MRVEQLIEMLKEFDPDTMVRGTHGPQLNEINVYDDLHGSVVVDTYGGRYQSFFQGTETAILID